MPNQGFTLLLALLAVGNLYACGGLVLIAAGKKNWLLERHFELGKFHLLMGWVPLVFIALAVTEDIRFLALFVVGGMAGIVGELLVSFHWRAFFGEPIWLYGPGARVGGMTSILNFLPWAMGTLLFVICGRFVFQADRTFGAPVATAAAALVGGLILSTSIRGLRGKAERKFNGPSFALFCAPIVTTAVALGALHNLKYPTLMLISSLIGFATEYTYGRAMTLFFEEPLWTYQRWPIDNGHSSFVTLPLWALGGLYFHFAAAAVGL